jgi:dTDP-4-amino-4,6-dideoxygalactose transaminase
MNIPFVDLTAQYNSIKNNIDDAIANVIGDTAFIGGKYVKEFEKNFAELYGVKHCISCANGTDSLYILMKMMNIGAGDEVITVANSWISSSETISQTGATPVFVDVDPVYYSMDVHKFEAAITSNTKALILVHLQGQMCDIELVKNICDKNNIVIVEDCAQSHFSEQNGKRSGTIGIAGSFSFYPGKNLGAYGDAGCIITNDDTLAEKCKMYANHGALVKHQHKIEGINSRLDGLQAAILNAKLPYILQWTEQRISNAAKYDEALKNISQVVTPKVRENTKHTFHLYVVQVEQREALMAHLKEKGIETVIHYPSPLPSLPCYAYLNTKEEDYKVSSTLQHKILSLPLYPELKEEQITYIADCIKEFYSN